jgi:ABC-2 type transport system permease protein
MTPPPVSPRKRLLESVAGWPFWPMIRKEFTQMRRDRLTLAMMVGIPAIQLLLFGFAIQTEVRTSHRCPR